MSETTKKKQTRKSISMPGYVYDAFCAACETAGVPVAAQNERLVRSGLSEISGEPLAAPEKRERPKAEPRPKSSKKGSKKKTAKKAPAKRKAADAPTLADVLPPVVSRVETETGLLVTRADGSEVEHLNEPTEEMEAAGDPFYTGVDVAKGPDTAVEAEVEYIDDRQVVVEEVEYIDDGDGVAF